MSDSPIAPGTRLSRPLVHPSTHMVMLPAGTVLTESYIERLARQGLTEQLLACLEAPTAGAAGAGPKVKDLDDFEIDIPDLPDILSQFFPGPAVAAAAGATGAPMAGHAAGTAPPVAAAPHAAWMPPGHAGQAAAPPDWLNAGSSVPVAPGPRPAAAPPTARYHHNPGHFLSERGVMGAMYAVEQVEATLKAGQLPPLDAFSRVVEEVLDRMAAVAPRLNDGIELRIVNQPHAKSHPVNVFILSVAMGMALGYDRDRLRTLGIGALCHDLGKTAVPAEVLNKVGPLTPQDVDLLRSHPLVGKRIVEKLPWGSPLVARIVYEHHERCDGSGYPMRLAGAQIHEMSKIVAVAEVYDALISDTSYRPRYTPELAYGTIRDGAKMGLAPEVVRAFLKFVVPYPLNTHVLLDNGEVAQVVQISRLNVLKPTVKLAGGTLDLARDERRSIVNSQFQAF